MFLFHRHVFVKKKTSLKSHKKCNFRLVLHFLIWGAANNWSLHLFRGTACVKFCKKKCADWIIICINESGWGASSSSSSSSSNLKFNSWRVNEARSFLKQHTENFHRQIINARWCKRLQADFFSLYSTLKNVNQSSKFGVKKTDAGWWWLFCVKMQNHEIVVIKRRREMCKVWKECIENIQPHLSGFVNEEWER
jgi:hypothetical protein